VLAALALGHTGVALADEGQWMPRQIPELDESALRRAGLELPLSELHALDEKGNQVGLLSAIVNLSGCSAGFVSKGGLVATNHHCAYGAIQAASSVDHDYLGDGFVAKDRASEIVAKNTTVQIVESVTDVTKRVRDVADAQTDPAARAKAVEDLKKVLVAECESTPSRKCRVADFYATSEVQLIASIELKDVRLVYAPPSSVGNFGGEVDNWMWPRHTGDFSLLRAYVGPDGEPAEHSPANVPYEPKRHLAVGDGVAPGDFVAVLGFPGSTQRYQSADEVVRHIEQVYPGRIDLYGEWIAIMDAAGAKDPAVKIKVAAKMKSLQNRFKNAQGMIDGLRRNGTVARRKAEDEALRAWAAEHPEGDPTPTLDALAGVAAERKAEFDRDFLIENLMRGSNALALAIDVVRRARERSKPDLERVTEYMDRSAGELWQTQTRRIRDFDAGVDRALLASLLRRIDALPAERRFATGEADALVRTRLVDEDFAKSMWDADWAAIEKSTDPMIAFARSLVPAIEAHEARMRAREGVVLGVGPKYFEMLREIRKGPVYPDANSTLRMSWGTVGGYVPREGLQAIPQTTVTGMVDKHTGVDPFDVPQRVRDAATRSRSSRWVDAKLGDVPTAFLANCDTTGGNSGSPVIDGKGRWVGLNFDRVWENVAGDFGYSVERSRNIVVDVRYLLWQLDEVEHAQWILDELGIVAKPTSAEPTATAPTAPTAPRADCEVGVPLRPSQVPRPESVRTGCGCDLDGRSSSPALLLGLFVLLTRTRSRR
jgi:hypothetical protein